MDYWVYTFGLAVVKSFERDRVRFRTVAYLEFGSSVKIRKIRVKMEEDGTWKIQVVDGTKP